MNTHFKHFWGLCVIGLILFSQCFGFIPTVEAAGNDLFVKSDGTGTDCSQSNPCEPGQAMANALAGDTIYFKYGAYTNPSSNPYLTIAKPVSLIGGWDGSTTGDVVVDPDIYVVIVDGGSSRALFVVNDTSGTGGLITITGFTFQNGYAAPSGGAIYIQSGRVDVVGNTFLDNVAGSYGGAIYVGSSSGTQILRNSFIDNEVTWGGGSIYAGSSSAMTLIEGNVFTGGNADYGTAIHNDSSQVIINANLFKDDPGTSTIDIYSYSVGSIVSNNIIIRFNQYAIYLMGENTAQHEIINNTIINGRYGIAPTTSYVDITNNIISNTTNSIFFASGNMVGSNNLFYGNSDNSYPLTNPVYDDPLFVDPSTDNYHLDDESPAVDSGIVVPLAEDFDGDERPIGEGFDIGADEVLDELFSYLPLIVR